MVLPVAPSDGGGGGRGATVGDKALPAAAALPPHAVLSQTDADGGHAASHGHRSQQGGHEGRARDHGGGGDLGRELEGGQRGARHVRDNIDCVASAHFVFISFGSFGNQ